jgi:hypothetical protein
MEKIPEHSWHNIDVSLMISQLGKGRKGRASGRFRRFEAEGKVYTLKDVHLVATVAEGAADDFSHEVGPHPPLSRGSKADEIPGTKG